MRVACLQLCSQDRIDDNLAIIDRLLTAAAAQGVAMAVLPEMFAFMHPDRDRKQQVAEHEAHQRLLPFLAEQALRHQLTIIGGSLLLPGEHPRLRNYCPVFSANGERIAGYDKIHLFDSDLPDRRYHESDQIDAGGSPRMLTIGHWRIGLSICYDLRFPELFRCYADNGVDLLTVPSAFTIPTGTAHWEVLLRARAIENQAYVLAPAQIGTHPGGRKTYGHTMIIDPWGIIIAQARNDTPDGELVVADLSRERLDEVRQQLPALHHRRRDLFPPPDIDTAEHLR